jgi:hypothetical protein
MKYIYFVTTQPRLLRFNPENPQILHIGRDKLRFGCDEMNRDGLRKGRTLQVPSLMSY